MMQQRRLATDEALPLNAALIVIDVQEAFSHPKWGERNNLEAEKNIAALIATWRRTKRPVIHIRHISRTPGSLFALDAPSSVLKAGVAPTHGERVIQKFENSAFSDTDLEQRLRDASIAHVVIVGLTTDHCVSTTTRMAANLGFMTILVADATATRIAHWPPRSTLHGAIDARRQHRESSRRIRDDRRYGRALGAGRR